MRTYLPILPIPGPSTDLAEAATLLGLIAQEKRLTLVALLAREELCVCELVERLGWSQPLISHHLGALRKAGLVRDRRDVHWVYYSLAPERVEELRRVLNAIFGDGPLPDAAQYGANRRCAT